MDERLGSGVAVDALRSAAETDLEHERLGSHSSSSLHSRVSPWLVDVRLSLMAETKIQRHSSKLTIGELVQQLASRYGQLAVTDTSGVKLGSELTLGELSAAASVSSAPLRQL